MPTFLETMYQLSLSATGSWETVDLSGQIPSGAVGAIFQVHIQFSTYFGMRKPGTTAPTFYNDDPYGYYSLTTFACGISSSRTIEIYRGSTSMTVALCGYFYESEAYFMQPVELPLPSSTAWTNFDISSYIQQGDTAIAAIVVLGKVSTNWPGYPWGLRMAGSSENRYGSCYGFSGGIIGVHPSNNQFAVYARNVFKLYLFGYVKAGAGRFFHNSVSMGDYFKNINASTWYTLYMSQRISGLVVEYTTAGYYAIRPNGDTLFLSGRPGSYSAGHLITGVSSNGKIDTYSSVADPEMHIVGEFYPYSSPYSPSIETVVVDPGGSGDYSSLLSWESAEEKNLVSVNKIHQVICKTTNGNADDFGSSQLVIDGWTTDYYRNVRIQVHENYRHTGVWSPTKFRVVSAYAAGAAIDVRAPFTRIEGLQVDCPQGAVLLATSATNDVDDVKIMHGIIAKGPVQYGDETPRRALCARHISGSNQHWFVISNCMVLDFYRVGYPPDTNKLGFAIFKEVTDGKSYACLENCLAIGCGRNYYAAIYGGLTTAANNCISVDPYGNSFEGYFITSVSHNNISDNSTVVGVSSQANVEPTFVDKASRNMHLASNDTIARNKGYPMGYFFLGFETRDMDLYQRPGALEENWDAGPFEYHEATSGEYEGSVSDGCTLSDSLSLLGNLISSLTDAISVSDILNNTATQYVNIEDGISASDYHNTIPQIYLSFATEILAGEDLNGHVRTELSMLDSASVTDEQGGPVRFTVSVLNSMIVFMFIYSGQGQYVSLSETINLSDTVKGLTRVPLSRLDSLSIRELAGIGGSLQLSRSETLQLLDELSGLVQMPATLTDGIDVSEELAGPPSYLGSVSDGMQLSDEADRSMGLVGSLSEAISASDTRASVLMALASVTGSMILEDLFLTLLRAVGSVSEEMTGEDEESSPRAFTGTLTDVIEASETWNLLSGAVASLDETLTVQDQIGSQAFFTTELDEQLTAQDIVNGLMQTVLELTEELRAGETLDGNIQVLLSNAEAILMEEGIEQPRAILLSLAEALLITLERVSASLGVPRAIKLFRAGTHLIPRIVGREKLLTRVTCNTIIGPRMSGKLRISRKENAGHA